MLHCLRDRVVVLRSARQHSPPRCGTWGTPPKPGEASNAGVSGPSPSASCAIVRCAPCATLRVCLHLRQIRRNSYEIRANFVPNSCLLMFGAIVRFQTFLWDSYEIGINCCEVVGNVYRVLSIVKLLLHRCSLFLECYPQYFAFVSRCHSTRAPRRCATTGASGSPLIIGCT